MAKTLTQQEEIREKILHSAKNLFSERGFDNVVMQNIADASRVPMADIFEYYPTKKDLYDAVMQCVSKTQLIKVINDMSASTSCAKEKLINILDKSIQGTIDTSTHQLSIATSAANVHNAFANIMRNSTLDSIPVIKKMIREGVKEGSFSTEFPDECAELFILLINHWNEKHLLEYDLGASQRQYGFLQKIMRQIGVDIVTDNLVKKLVEMSAKIHEAAVKNEQKSKF